MKKQYYLLFFVTLFTIFTCSNFDVNANKINKSEVKFTFDGLQVLAFGDPRRVSDGILDVAHHTPKIEVKQIQNGKEKTIVKYQGKELYQKSLTISLPNKSLDLAKPSRYYSSDMQKDKKDFRWCLDMESDLFQKQLYLKEDKLFTKIHFTTGTFFTSQLLDGKYQFIAGSKLHSFNRQVGAPGASLELQHNDTLLITGLDKEIRLPYQTGITYKVDITNLPPKEMASINHFAFYYDVFKDQTVTRFMPVETIKKVSFRPAPFLCEAVILSKSSIK